MIRDTSHVTYLKTTLVSYCGPHAIWALWAAVKLYTEMISPARGIRPHLCFISISSIYLSIDVSIYLSIYPSICLSIYLSIYQSIYLSGAHGCFQESGALIWASPPQKNTLINKHTYIYIYIIYFFTDR